MHIKILSYIKQPLFYGVVGLITLMIDVVVTASLYNFLKVPAFFASAAGFSSGFFFNFPMNRKRVFKHSSKDRFSLKYQIVMYISLSIFNLAATSGAVDLMVSLNILDIKYAKILSTAVMAVWNFLLFKFIIFSKK